MRHERALKFIDHLKLMLGFAVRIGEIKKQGWKKPLPLYLFTCPKHGWVESHPKGFTKRLECPICLEEERVFHNIDLDLDQLES